MSVIRIILVSICLWGVVPSKLMAGEVLVAVATNFLKPMKELAAKFHEQTGHQAILSAGSSGKLFAQIQHGAPFELFLSADSLRPKLLEERGQGIKDSRFVYAIGRLVLWSRDRTMLKKPFPPNLHAMSFRHIALANPKTAPYGAAAKEVLQKLQVWDSVSGRIVQGENVGQALQYIASGNAELGFVAFSQVLQLKAHDQGSWWEVPAHLHAPIAQSAILLQAGHTNPAAKSLLSFLHSVEGRELIQKFGYQVAREE